MRHPLFSGVYSTAKLQVAQERIEELKSANKHCHEAMKKMANQIVELEASLEIISRDYNESAQECNSLRSALSALTQSQRGTEP